MHTFQKSMILITHLYCKTIVMEDLDSFQWHQWHCQLKLEQWNGGRKVHLERIFDLAPSAINNIVGDIKHWVHIKWTKWRKASDVINSILFYHNKTTCICTILALQFHMLLVQKIFFMFWWCPMMCIGSIG